MKSYTCVKDTKPIPYTIDETLASEIENILTKLYIDIRIRSINRNYDINLHMMIRV